MVCSWTFYSDPPCASSPWALPPPLPRSPPHGTPRSAVWWRSPAITQHVMSGSPCIVIRFHLPSGLMVGTASPPGATIPILTRDAAFIYISFQSNRVLVLKLAASRLGPCCARSLAAHQLAVVKKNNIFKKTSLVHHSMPSLPLSSTSPFYGWRRSPRSWKHSSESLIPVSQIHITLASPCKWHQSSPQSPPCLPWAGHHTFALPNPAAKWTMKVSVGDWLASAAGSSNRRIFSMASQTAVGGTS